MAKLKMRKQNGVFIVTYDGKEIVFTALHDAIEYIFHRKFMAEVSGEYIGYYNTTLYPVNSLLPPVVEKVAKFYDLGAEII